MSIFETEILSKFSQEVGVETYLLKYVKLQETLFLFLIN